MTGELLSFENSVFLKAQTDQAVIETTPQNENLA